MKKTYRNTRFRVSWPEMLGVLFFGILLLGASWAHISYERLASVFNIAKTKIDYIIQAPSKEQVVQIKQLDHVAHIVPYYYRFIEVPTAKGTLHTNLQIIDNETDLAYTPFADDLLLQKAKVAGENKLYISDDFAKNSGWRVGKFVEFTIGQTPLRFSVAGVYKSDDRYVGGLLIAIKSSPVTVAMSNAKYSGAFINSKNRAISGVYFKTEYKPSYLSIEEIKMPTETFVVGDYLQDKTRRYAAQVSRAFYSWIGLLLLAYAVLGAVNFWRAKMYCQKWVCVDLADNFTVNQEIAMYQRYFINLFVLLLLVQAVVYFVGRMWTVWLISDFTLISLGLSILLVGLLTVYWTCQLKVKFLPKPSLAVGVTHK